LVEGFRDYLLQLPSTKADDAAAILYDFFSAYTVARIGQDYRDEEIDPVLASEEILAIAKAAASVAQNLTKYLNES